MLIAHEVLLSALHALLVAHDELVIAHDAQLLAAYRALLAHEMCDMSSICAANVAHIVLLHAHDVAYHAAL